MVLRKLYRQGNSVVVAIPSNMLAALKLEKGDLVTISRNVRKKTLQIASFTPGSIVRKKV